MMSFLSGHRRVEVERPEPRPRQGARTWRHGRALPKRRLEVKRHLESFRCGLYRLFAVLAAAVLSPNASASVLDWIFPKHDVQVVAVTDTTPVGALRRPASPANPVYYAAVSAGYRDFGGIVGGIKEPPKEEVVKTIAKVLAKQGYLPSNDAHPPSLLLVWVWGTMNTDLMPMFTADGEMSEMNQQVNRNQLLRFLGAYKLGMISKEPTAYSSDLLLPGAMFRDADRDYIGDLATEDLFVAAISAYDYAAALRKEKALLWMTKISCPSRGLALPQTLPAMLALAGPYIGRETEKPVSLKATEEFKAEVKIGDPTVVEYLDTNQLPIVEAATPATKKSGPPKKKKR
jgi:hypothetical protein